MKAEVGIEWEVGLQTCESEVEQEHRDEKLLNVNLFEKTHKLIAEIEPLKNRFDLAFFKRKRFGQHKISEDNIAQRNCRSYERRYIQTVSAQQSAQCRASQ